MASMKYDGFQCMKKLHIGIQEDGKSGAEENATHLKAVARE
jgi:hypothetical protein